MPTIGHGRLLLYFVQQIGAILAELVELLQKIQQFIHIPAKTRVFS